MSPSHDDQANPFAPPGADFGHADAAAPPEEFFALFLRWERYRMVYNAVLFLESVACLATMPARRLEFALGNLIGCAIVANVCFCAGLILNGYAWLLGWRGPWVGWLIFAAGTILSVILAGMVLVVLSRPDLIPLLD